MVALGEQCSMTERRADDATREVDAWLKCEFLKDRIDEEFGGVIAAVTNFGVFVELNDLYIEGLMHVSALPGDYYHFDQVKQRSDRGANPSGLSAGWCGDGQGRSRGSR